MLVLAHADVRVANEDLLMPRVVGAQETKGSLLHYIWRPLQMPSAHLNFLVHRLMAVPGSAVDTDISGSLRRLFQSLRAFPGRPRRRQWRRGI